MSYTPGLYEVTILAQGFDESKDKKTPHFWLTFKPIGRITDGAMIEVDQQYERTVRLWLSEKAAPHTLKKLRELGWAGTSFKDLDPQTGSFSFVGRTIELRCSEGDSGYDEWEFPRAERQESTHNPSLVRSLDALFGSELKKTGKSAARQSQAVRQSVPATRLATETAPERETVEAGRADDIPF